MVFTSLFWAFDLLTEHRGKAYAFRVLILSFALCLLMTLWMLMTIAYPVAPLPASLAAHHAMEVLFSPAPALFAASLIAYLLSQALDIVVFTRIKSWTGQKYVWLRATVAALVGGFVDHVLFCVLAWGLFAAQPLDTSTLIHAYILKAYLFRAVLALGSAPLLLLVQFFRKKGFTVIDFPWFKDREAHD